MFLVQNEATSLTKKALVLKVTVLFYFLMFDFLLVLLNLHILLRHTICFEDRILTYHIDKQIKLLVFFFRQTLRITVQFLPLLIIHSVSLKQLIVLFVSFLQVKFQIALNLQYELPLLRELPT